MWDKELILHRELEQLPTEQLRTMLRKETGKHVPDDDLVLSILHILEDREPDVPDSGSEREATAWKRFRKRVQARKKSSFLHRSSLLKVASTVLVICMFLVLVPQQAEADNWWQRITKWTDEFFGFFREEEETFRLEDYEFRTDNPGLQQVYDAVTELGVTVPAVPMWLPEGYVLDECTVTETRTKKYVYVRFLNGDQECVLQINILNTDSPKYYFKGEEDVEEYETGGMIHGIVDNEGQWIVSWTRDNMESSVFIDCSKDVLYKIIQSVYRGRINE